MYLFVYLLGNYFIIHGQKEDVVESVPPRISYPSLIEYPIISSSLPHLLDFYFIECNTLIFVLLSVKLTIAPSSTLYF